MPSRVKMRKDWIICTAVVKSRTLDRMLHHLPNYFPISTNYFQVVTELHLRDFRFDILEQKSKIHEMFLFCDIETIFSVQKLDHSTIGVPDRSVVLDFQAFHAFD